MDIPQSAIFIRRSIRRFLDKPVEDEKLERILRAGMQAPSSHNTQPWEFLVARDKAALAHISNMSPHAHLAAFAGAAIITLSNADFENPTPLYWLLDCAAATENMLLQIVEEGLGGCWLGCFPNPERVRYLRDYFALPEKLTPFSVVALGYSDRPNAFVNRYKPERVHWEKY